MIVAIITKIMKNMLNNIIGTKISNIVGKNIADSIPRRNDKTIFVKVPFFLKIFRPIRKPSMKQIRVSRLLGIKINIRMLDNKIN